MANDNDIPIFEEDISEFEFERFSVFYDASEDTWFLETDGDDDEKDYFIIQNADITYADGSEEFSALGFTLENFTTLKEFINENTASA